MLRRGRSERTEPGVTCGILDWLRCSAGMVAAALLVMSCLPPGSRSSGAPAPSGYDGGDSVSKEYKPRFPFAGGQVIKVAFDMAEEAYVDVEQCQNAILEWSIVLQTKAP